MRLSFALVCACAMCSLGAGLGAAGTMNRLPKEVMNHGRPRAHSPLRLVRVGLAGVPLRHTARYLCSHGLRPCWLPRVWAAIGYCETGLDWHHLNSSYEGAFGFAIGAWNQFSGGVPFYRNGRFASPWQQYQIALRIYRRYGFSGWGCVTHGGYLVWLARL